MTSFVHMNPMLTHWLYCAVAQLAVASDFESDGWRFESFLRSKISIIACLLSSRSSMEERFFDSELTIVRFNPGRLAIMLAMYAVWIQIYRMSRNTAIFRYGGYKQPVNKPTCVNANHITMKLRMQIRHMMMRYCHRCHCRIGSGLMMNPLHAWFMAMKWYEWMSSLRTMPSYVECGAACPAWLWAYGWFPTGLRPWCMDALQSWENKVLIIAFNQDKWVLFYSKILILLHSWLQSNRNMIQCCKKWQYH